MVASIIGKILAPHGADDATVKKFTDLIAKCAEPSEQAKKRRVALERFTATPPAGHA